MIHITNIQNGLKIFEALSSPVRLQIIDLLHQGNELNINDLAEALKLTNSALTMHIKKLEDCGLIRVRLATIPRGVQKLCSLADDKIFIELIDQLSSEKSYEVELDVGMYTAFKINPTCGLSNETHLIGDLDNPVSFALPERFGAKVLWFTDGFVTYTFPNPLLKNQIAKEIQFNVEIAGEAPGASEHFPSDIKFFIGDKELCTYECPGEFFERRGRFTPEWWFKNFGQYGRAKIICINHEGTFLDGFRVGDVTIDDVISAGKQIELKISCEERSKHLGGITLFGKGFGDYNQGIRCRLIYNEKN